MFWLRYNLRSLVVRRITSGAAVLGIALVVFVLSSSLMLAAGIRRTLQQAGRADQAIVLSDNSSAESVSSFPRSQLGVIQNEPEVAADDHGRPLAVGEVVALLAMKRSGAAELANVQLRGVSDDYRRLRPQLEIVAGRPPRPGTGEAMVGVRLRGQFEGFEPGGGVPLQKGRALRVVGVFSDRGSQYESEVWTDAETVRAAFNMEDLVSSVRVRLRSPQELAPFVRRVEQDERLEVAALGEVEFYQKQSEGTAVFVQMMGTLIALVFSVGAILGAMITMHASIARRRTEIGTLRAIGFSKRRILASFLLESALLGVTGGVAGSLASLLLGAARFSFFNFGSFSETVFSFTPSLQTHSISIGFAVGMGLVGGLLPALRAAWTPPVVAMRR